MYKSIIKFGAVALISTAFVACGDEDVYNPNAALDAQKTEYAANFVAKYGDISSSQSWDFTTKQPTFSLTNGSRSVGVRTRAGESEYVTTNDWYEVDLNTVQWMTNVLKESTNNSSKGNPFYMTVPGNEFTIVPIYQGQAGEVWDLHVVIEDYDNAGNSLDLNVWSKGQNLQKSTNKNKVSWQDVGNGNTLDAKAVRAKSYTFKNLPEGKTMYFYLKVTTGFTNYANKGTEQSSLNHMMLALDVPEESMPDNIEAGNQIMIIGCEDANLSRSDWDYNDVVFMMYGKPYIPQVINISEGDEITETTTARYMIEDLGATDDFDFNDVVVDVSKITKKTPKYVNGEFDSWTGVTTTQEAVIRHLGGTLPFKLTIGNTTLDEHEGMLDADPDEKFTVEGWDITKHNIQVEVNGSNNIGVYKIQFPKAGEAPMIIAVEKSLEWMPERQSVPTDWFTVEE